MRNAGPLRLSGVVGAVPSVMVGLFPAPIRVSGISFTYNIAYALWASTTPLLLIALMPWSPWVCLGFCALMGLVGLSTAWRYGFSGVTAVERRLLAKAEM